MRTRTLFAAVLGLATLPFTAGCDLFGGGTDLESNTFTVRVGSGTVQSRTNAAFGVVTEGQDELFGLALGGIFDETDTTFTQPVIVFAGMNTELPAEGEYDLFDLTANTELPEPPSGEVVALYIAPGEDEETVPTFYLSESGTLEVEESAVSSIRGEYSFRARAFTFDPETFELVALPTRQTISGEFNARRDDALFEGGALLRPLPFSAAAAH